ncbi:hypothetical protein ABIC09_007473 [Bradyrhizobium sp. S3.12.5]
MKFNACTTASACRNAPLRAAWAWPKARSASTLTCRDGFSVLYKRTSRLFADLAQVRGEGRLARLIAALKRVNLLILDLCGAHSDVELRVDNRRRSGF